MSFFPQSFNSNYANRKNLMEKFENSQINQIIQNKDLDIKNNFIKNPSSNKNSPNTDLNNSNINKQFNNNKNITNSFTGSSKIFLIYFIINK